MEIKGPFIEGDITPEKVYWLSSGIIVLYSLKRSIGYHQV